MAIRYRFEENSLKPGTFYARVIPGDVRNLQAMIPDIVDETALSGTDVKGVIDALINEIVGTLAEGRPVKIDGLVTFGLSLSGSFESNDVSITSENADLNVLAEEAHALEAAVTQQVTFVREAGQVKAPLISTIIDVATDTYNAYTAPGILRIKGENLNFNEANTDEGVFLNDGTTETRLTVYSVAGEKQIDALLPPDLTGDLTVTVRARYSEGGEMRQGSYQRAISPA